MSAPAVLKEAADCGVRVSLNGDRVALKGAVKAPADLLAKLQKHKAAIVALLRAEGKPEHAASAPGTPATPGTTATLPTYQAALAKFKEHRPHGFTRFRHDQAVWAAEMFLNEWGELACEFDVLFACAAVSKTLTKRGCGATNPAPGISGSIAPIGIGGA
jgi:hypothetical protein